MKTEDIRSCPRQFCSLALGRESVYLIKVTKYFSFSVLYSYNLWLLLMFACKNLVATMLNLLNLIIVPLRYHHNIWVFSLYLCMNVSLMNMHTCTYTCIYIHTWKYMCIAH